MHYKNLFVRCLFIFTAAVAHGKGSHTSYSIQNVRSPDGKINLSMFRGDNGQLRYVVDREGTVLLESSRMGVEANGDILGRDATISPLGTYSRNETYPWRGVHSEAIDYCNGAEFTIHDKQTGKTFVLEARAYNNGVCFRYRVEGKGRMVITKDLTRFVIPQDSTTWAVAGKEEGLVASGKTSAGKAFPEEAPCLPMTAKLPSGTYLSIMEAARGSFPGVRTLVDVGNGVFETKIEGKASAENTLATPWRVIKISPDLNGLVNNDILHNLSPKADRKLFPKGIHTEWLKGGKVAWSWMCAGGPKGVNLTTQKEFVDYAHTMGYEFILVDEGWRHWDETGQYGCDVKKCATDHGNTAWDVMAELVGYARERGVGVWVWKAFNNRRNIPGIKDPTARRAFLQRCSELGIAGVKLDFFPAPSQEIMQWQEDTLREAAEMKLMVNFHGCAVPDGHVRTWPNEMTREAIRGMEHRGRENHSYQMTVLPFTRLLAGHADFTPLFMKMGNVSLANHIAAIGIMDSAVVHFCSHPRDIQKLGDEESRFIMGIPETWDETIVLPSSQIGEVVAFARRKGNTWYLMVLSSSEKDLTIPLRFLKKTLTYEMTGIREGDPFKSKIQLEGKPADNNGKIILKLKNGSGYIARFEEK